MIDEHYGGTSLPNEKDESALGGDDVPEPSPSLQREGLIL